MDYSALVQAISAVGFPIVMCILMAWYIKSNADSYRSDVKALQETIDKNTAAINMLADKLEDNKDATWN